MGNTDRIVVPWFKKHIKATPPTALLGFTNNKTFEGDCYDRELGNWEINSKWQLPKKYKTVISLRCPYFAKSPLGFINRCHSSLDENGMLYASWGYGDHWGFRRFKVGWEKDGEHEYAYADDNYLWSGIWDDSFMDEPEVRKFAARCKKQHGYRSLPEAINNEVPTHIILKPIQEMFDVKCHFFCTTVPRLQLYILLCGKKI